MSKTITAKWQTHEYPIVNQINDSELDSVTTTVSARRTMHIPVMQTVDKDKYIVVSVKTLNDSYTLEELQKLNINGVSCMLRSGALVSEGLLPAGSELELIDPSKLYDVNPIGIYAYEGVDFEIQTSYAIGKEEFLSKMKYVSEVDPLVQKSYLEFLLDEISKAIESPITLHNLLDGRRDFYCHPIHSITGLRDELDLKLEKSKYPVIDGSSLPLMLINVTAITVAGVTAVAPDDGFVVFDGYRTGSWPTGAYGYVNGAKVYVAFVNAASTITSPPIFVQKGAVVKVDSPGGNQSGISRFQVAFYPYNVVEI